MHDVVSKLDVFAISLSQDVPYLGSLRDGEQVNDRGYFVRTGNRTVYPQDYRSLVLRLETQGGVEGWGETYGLVAPKATAEIINDLLAAFVVDRSVLDAECIHDDLYDLMRVRGYTGGFYLDALAAIDIALWDAAGKLLKQPVARMLGGRRRNNIPAYVSGLPKETLEQRRDLATAFQERGFADFKFALPVADQGGVKEMATLRERLGDKARIACDMHWAYSRDEALSFAREVSAYQPWFLEAPVATEDVAGLRHVAQHATCPIAVGEEWRTVFDARARIDQQACHIVQPEMGHTGITQFMRIGHYAQAHHLTVIPHATIGIGIFLAASLQASAALRNVKSHEYQHSVFGKTQHLLSSNLQCENGCYSVPDGHGLGVEPTTEMMSRLEPIK